MRFRFKQKIILYVLLALNILSAVYVFYPQEPIVPTETPEKILLSEPVVWKTKRHIPETVDLGAYLTAFTALQNQNLDVVADKYLQVLKTDKSNEKLAQEAYFLNALLIRFDKIRFLVDNLSKTHQPALLTEYAEVAYAAKEQNWQKMRDILDGKDAHPLDAFLGQLLRAWSYAAENNSVAAYAALDKLKKNPDFMPYYAYHKGLIGLYFKDVTTADLEFRHMAENSLITASCLPEMQAFFMTNNAWNLNNPLFVQTQLLQAKQPATLELMRAMPVRSITPIRGMAEALYNVSTALGPDASVQESALILNALSLYLQPKALLPLVWGGEILEAIGKPAFASYYYEQMDGVTNTLRFKKAMNLIQRGQKEKALVILNKLKASNSDSLVLWLALAGVYAESEDWHKTVDAYTHALETKENLPEAKKAEIYFARAFFYDKINESDLAESDLLRALALNPDDATILNHLGYRWMEKNTNREKGFELVKKAYKLKPLDPYIIDSMAFGYYCEGNYTQAVALAEQSVDLMPQSSVANAHLGDIYAALGRKREAGFQYYKALGLKSDLTPELEKELTQKLAKK